MHPTDTLALSGLSIARAAAAGEGSARGPQVKCAPAHDRMIAGMSAAGSDLVFEREMQTLAQAIEAMWSDPDPRSTTRTDAGASTSARMGEGFARAYADHYVARGTAVQVFRADGTIETMNRTRSAFLMDETTGQ